MNIEGQMIPLPPPKIVHKHFPFKQNETEGNYRKKTTWLIFELSSEIQSEEIDSTVADFLSLVYAE